MFVKSCRLNGHFHSDVSSSRRNSITNRQKKKNENSSLVSTAEENYRGPGGHVTRSLFHVRSFKHVACTYYYGHARTVRNSIRRSEKGRTFSSSRERGKRYGLNGPHATRP